MSLPAQGEQAVPAYGFESKTEKYRRPLYPRVKPEKIATKFELEFTRQIISSPMGRII
jgi:hypothetical protein